MVVALAGVLLLLCQAPPSRAGDLHGVTSPVSVQQIVQQFYPQRLVDLAARAGDDDVDRRQCYAVYETDRSGAPRTIVAAYTNTSSADVRVLQADAAGAWHVAAAPEGFDFFGADCTIALDDLDGDGRQDVFLTFGVMVSDVSWAFTWDGHALTNLTPVRAGAKGALATMLHNAELVDVDNDGVKEIVTVGQYPPPVDAPAKPNDVYKLVNGHYVKSESVLGLWTFERDAGAPQTVRVPVSLRAGARGPYTLHLVNGAPGGTSRVTSAEVWVNDTLVLGPADFSNNVAEADRTVALTGKNQVAVRLAGAPGSRMILIVRSRDWDQ
jgi:hypothetical protein